MGATNFDGPVFVYGDLGQLESTPGGTTLLPDPNPDRGPSVLFGGFGFPDTRYLFAKDTVQGYTGRVPSIVSASELVSVNAIPATHATNNIVASAHTTSGTAMTLNTTQAYGVAINVPIIPFATPGFAASASVTAPIVLDFGFAYGTTTTGASATTVTVLDSTMFYVGMPIVIPGAGGTNIALLTWVTGLPTATTITVNDPALAAGNFPIGGGEPWSPSEFGQIEPIAHFPMLASGPGAFLDPRQALARGIVTTVSAGTSSSNHLVVHGWDVYWQPMTESIPCTAATNYGKKAFKAIQSVIPDFTDGTNNYTVGTSDVFGFHQRLDNYEESFVWWAATFNTATQGIAIADETTPATTTTGDVRGTVQVSAIGGGTGIGSTATNGSVSTITISGNRLRISSSLTVWQQTQNRFAAPYYAFGVVQT